MLMPIHNLCNLYTAQKLNESHHCAAKNMLCNTFYIFNFCFFFAKDDDKQVQDNSIKILLMKIFTPAFPTCQDQGMAAGHLYLAKDTGFVWKTDHWFLDW